MYAAVVTPSEDDADLDLFSLNTGGYTPMCGQGVLAIMQVMLESGIMKVRARVQHTSWSHLCASNARGWRGPPCFFPKCSLIRVSAGSASLGTRVWPRFM